MRKDITNVGSLEYWMKLLGNDVDKFTLLLGHAYAHEKRLQANKLLVQMPRLKYITAAVLLVSGESVVVILPTDHGSTPTIEALARVCVLATAMFCKTLVAFEAAKILAQNVLKGQTAVMSGVGTFIVQMPAHSNGIECISPHNVRLQINNYVRSIVLGLDSTGKSLMDAAYYAGAPIPASHLSAFNNQLMIINDEYGYLGLDLSIPKQVLASIDDWSKDQGVSMQHSLDLPNFI